VAVDERMRPHVDDEVQVARLAAVAPDAALARDPDPRSVTDPGRNLHAEPLAGLDDAGSAAGRAGAPPNASGALAGGARRRPPHADRGPCAAWRVGLIGFARVPDVRAARVARLLGGAAEHLVQDVGESPVVAGAPAAAERPEVELEPRVTASAATEGEAVPAVGPALVLARARRIEAGLQAFHPELVVERPLLVVGEGVVGERQVLEALLGLLVPRVEIGMVLAGQLAVGLADLVGRSALGEPEDGVQISLLRHRRSGEAPHSPYCSRTFVSATSRSAVTISLLSDSTSGRAPFSSCFARRAASSTSSKRLGTCSRQSSTVMRAITWTFLTETPGEGNHPGCRLWGGPPGSQAP